MKPINQHITIAQFSGWSRVALEWRNWDSPATQYLRGNPKGYRDVFEEVPDFLSSYDAIHAAEQAIPDDRWDEYIGMLEWVLGLGRHHSICKHKRDLMKATPAQKCEAILRTFDLWKEEEP